MFEAILQELESVRANARCRDIKDKLEKLGFEVRDGKRGGHKIFVHDHLPSFMSGSFNCGHGKNPEIKPVYVRKIIRILKEHESDIKKYLEKGEDND